MINEITIKNQALLSKSEQEEREEDPFYSEENWNTMIKAKEQLDRSEGIIFNFEKTSE